MNSSQLVYSLSALLLIAIGSPLAAEATASNSSKHERKTVTLVNAKGDATSSSEISRELIKDCISSLPDAASLEPEITSENIYLREINGDANRNDWVRIYTAKLDLNWLEERKEMIIVTTRSVEGQPPVFKEVEKKLRQSKNFVSDPNGGDTYAGRSKRQYYFLKSEDAVKDVRDRAKSWINQQKTVVCSKG